MMMKDGKGTTKRQECQQGMVKLQQAIMGAFKRHIGNTLRNIRLDMRKKKWKKGLIDNLYGRGLSMFDN